MGIANVCNCCFSIFNWFRFSVSCLFKRKKSIYLVFYRLNVWDDWTIISFYSSFSDKKTETILEKENSVVDREDEYQGIKWYYLDKDHEQQGTVSFLDLKEFWIKGKVNSSTYVWNDGMEEWQKVCDTPN